MDEEVYECWKLSGLALRNSLTPLPALHPSTTLRALPQKATIA